MAKGRNNLLGVGGQRKKLPRAGQQGTNPAHQADRKTAVDQKQELLRRMRERTQSGPDATPSAPSAEPETSSAAPAEPAPDDAAQPGATGQDASAQS